MSRPAPPALTVRYDASTRTFAPGNDVVVGRDLRADIRIAHPLISRAHLVLRFDQGRWVAIDNGSLNGMYVNNRRVPTVDLQDGQHLNIGNPDGPQLSFDVGRHQVPLLRRMGEELGEAIAERLDLGADGRQVARVWGHGIVGMMYAAGDWWLGERPCSRAELVRSLADLLWGRLAAAGDRVGGPGF